MEPEVLVDQHLIVDAQVKLHLVTLAITRVVASLMEPEVSVDHHLTLVVAQ